MSALKDCHQSPARRIPASALVMLWILVQFFASGCSDDGGGGGKKVPPAAQVTGRVTGGGPVTGATVSFVEAFSAAASGSIQPIEDAAGAAAIKAVTDRDGRFSVTVPEGRYFVFVAPSDDDTIHSSGGSLSRESIGLSAGSTTVLNISLSEKPPATATYVGSSTCLECHPSFVTATQTLHFLGIRKLSAAGPVLSSLQDLSKFPDADRALAYFPDGNPDDNTGSDSDGYGYRVATASGYDVLLGRDGTGHFMAIEGPGGLVSKQLYVVFTYGGEGRFKQRFMTRLDGSGDATDDATLGSYYVLPAEFSEARGNPARGNETTVPGWIAYAPEEWGPPATGGGKPGKAPAQTRSFDNSCAGCHFTGMALTRSAEGLFQADAADDPGGPIDVDGDVTADEMNVGCERCHGPGSEHVSNGGGSIVQPELLPPGRANMICGQCHTQGTGNGTIGGEGRGGYPSRNHPEGGQIEFVRAGLSPAEFFGSSDGKNIAPEFGTSGGYLNPVDLATDSSAAWLDKAGGFGSAFDHSKANGQQYLDHARALHAVNPFEMLTCWSCHNPHARELKGQVRAPADNDVLCLRCHAGHGDFTPVTQEMVDTVEEGGAQPADISAALNGHVTERTFEMVGVAMAIGNGAYGNPAGESELGRCTTCHMPGTAKTASYIVDDEGFVIRGEIKSHTFDVISPDVSHRMGEAGQDPVPNSCVPCHRGPPRGAYPDYRHEKQ